MKTIYKVVQENNNTRYLKQINPHDEDVAGEFNSTEWSRFESKSEQEKIPLLGPDNKKQEYNRSEFDIVEAYMKDGYITFDIDRPYYGRNMGLKIIEAAYILAEN